MFFAGAIGSLLRGLKRSGKKNLGGKMSELSKFDKKVKGYPSEGRCSTPLARGLYTYTYTYYS